MSEFDSRAFAPPLRVPTLSRPPVMLRPYAVSDLAMVRQAADDPFIPSISTVPRTYSEGAGRAFIERQHARAAEGDGFSFVIAEESDPTTRHRFDRSVAPGDRERPGLHRLLAARPARGRGHAADALRAVVAFAFDELAVPRLHLFVEPWNVASSRTARAAGFTREATLRGWERIDGEQRDAECFALLLTERTDG